MNKIEYYRLIGQAIAEFVKVADELGTGPEAEADVRQWNDEFMLALYEVTNDERRA